MIFAEALGFAAAALTLIAFAQKALLRMRLAALGANLFFIGYGALGDHYPVLVLHLILLPLNAGRLLELAAKQRRRPGGASRQAPQRGSYEGEAMIRHACPMDLEGIVSKRRDSRRYRSGRCAAWLKVKNPLRAALSRPLAFPRRLPLGALARKALDVRLQGCPGQPPLPRRPKRGGRPAIPPGAPRASASLPAA